MDTPPQVPISTPPTQQELPAGNNNRALMGVLSYIGILVIIPFLMAKDDPFVKYHVKQGAVLAIIEIVVWVISGMFWGLFMLFSLIQLATVVLSIIGIVNVVQNQTKELPLVGSLAKHINI